MVAEADRDVRVPFKRPREHHAGQQQLPEPAHERCRRCATVGGTLPPRYTGVEIPSVVEAPLMTGA